MRLRRWWRNLMRREEIQAVLGGLVVAYMRLVVATSRKSYEPEDYVTAIGGQRPFILAVWHGEAFLVPFAAQAVHPMKAMTSRSREGGIMARIFASVGVESIRASGGRTGRQVAKRGGVAGLIAATHALKEGAIVGMTAEEHRGPGYVAGPGIIALAKHSGAPIIPVAAVSSRHIRIEKSWDRAAIPLPFGRIAVRFGEPVRVARDLDPAAETAARRALEASLGGAHARAYAAVGRGHG